MHHSTPGLPVQHQLPEPTQTHVDRGSDASKHLILCHPILLLPSIFPSIRVFSSVCFWHQVPKYWSFSFNISPSNEHSGLISFRMNWLDLLAVQETLQSLLQHYMHEYPSCSESLSALDVFRIIKINCKSSVIYVGECFAYVLL